MKPIARARKQRTPLSRKAKFIGAAVGAVLAWQIASISLAAGHGDSNNDLASADFAGASQAAAIAAAEQHLVANDFAGAKVFATQALSISTISAASLRDLGLAEQGLGNWQRSSALLSENAALGWRDPATQLWLAQAFLSQKDDESAAQRIDAALRVAPSSNDSFGILDQHIVNSGFLRAMIGRLQLDPNWRIQYLRYLDNVSPSVLAARSRLLIALSSSSAPPSRSEAVPLLYSLIQANQAKLARLVWMRVQHVSAGEIYDPNFQNAGTNNSNMAPFEWSLLSVPGANISLEALDSGNNLNITTDGTASGRLLSQVIALAPGPHSLNYDGTIPIIAHNAFGWSVRCVKDGRFLINTVRNASDPPYAFEVPRGCGAQRVDLLVASSAAAAGNKVSFRNLIIH